MGKKRKFSEFKQNKRVVFNLQKNIYIEAEPYDDGKRPTWAKSGEITPYALGEQLKLLQERDRQVHPDNRS